VEGIGIATDALNATSPSMPKVNESSTGKAALADAVVDVNFDAAIGNVLFAANAQPRSVEIGAALCICSQVDVGATVTPLLLRTALTVHTV